MLREESRREVLARYADLPSLPPKLLGPEYLVEGAPIYKRDKKSRAFYSACAQGDMAFLRDLIGNSAPSHADLQYGLEEASHGFQVDVVRYLMREHGVKLPFHCFHRRNYLHVTPSEERPPLLHKSSSIATAPS